jgi:deoxyhypusine synthase
MKLWAMKQAGLIPDYAFDLDLHAEVFEACAYHYWGLFQSDAKAMATLILGGGVPKNYNLQPEPALSQVLGLANVRGYEFDVQITTAPVTDGSLSSCPPAEAVTWGKVDKETYRQSTESLPGDYSMMMPFIVKALMEKHGPREPFRLYEKRDTLVETLRGAVRENRDWLIDSLHYPLAHA